MEAELCRTLLPKQQHWHAWKLRNLECKPSKRTGDPLGHSGPRTVAGTYKSGLKKCTWKPSCTTAWVRCF